MLTSTEEWAYAISENSHYPFQCHAEVLKNPNEHNDLWSCNKRTFICQFPQWVTGSRVTPCDLPEGSRQRPCRKCPIPSL